MSCLAPILRRRRGATGSPLWRYALTDGGVRYRPLGVDDATANRAWKREFGPEDYPLSEGGTLYQPLAVDDANNNNAFNGGPATMALDLQTLYANTRAGTVYQTTSAGGIEAVSANTTRTGHWRGGKRYRLFEPSRTNILTYSEDFSNAAWAKTSVTVTANSDLAPDGATTADTVTDADSGAGEDFVTRNSAVSNNSDTYTFSIFVKKTSGASAFPALLLAFTGGATAVDKRIVFNTNTGVITADTSPSNKGIEDFGNYWRVWISAANNTSGNTNMVSRFYPAYNTDGTITVNTAATGSNVFWGAQNELGSFPTSYIPTAASAVVRAAEVAGCSTSAFPIDQNGGSIEIIGRADYNTAGSGFPKIFQVDDGTNSNRIILDINEASAIMRLIVILGGIEQANEALSYTSGSEFHALLRFSENNVFLSLGGSDSTPDTTASFPTGLLTTWRWGRSVAGDNGAAVLINRLASHSHEFSTTAANAITG